MRLGRHNAAPLPAFLDAPEEYLRSVRTILASRENARATISWLPSDYSDSDVHEYDERIVRATESIRSEYPQADFKAFSTDVASEAEHADKNRRVLSVSIQRHRLDCHCFIDIGYSASVRKNTQIQRHSSVRQDASHPGRPEHKVRELRQRFVDKRASTVFAIVDPKRQRWSR